jgi:hypothetical protein
MALATGYFDHAKMAFECSDIAQHISLELGLDSANIVNARVSAIRS